MNQLRRGMISKLTFMLITVLVAGTLSMATTANAESNQMEDLLPQYNGYTWNYHGFVEYGHEMKISSIMKTDNQVYYAIDGKVYDASGGESGADYSLSLRENTGVIFFEKLMLNTSGNYEVTYSINDETSGVHEESKF
jgi:hypothetical protein